MPAVATVSDGLILVDARTGSDFGVCVDSNDAVDLVLMPSVHRIVQEESRMAGESLLEFTDGVASRGIELT